MGKCWPQNLQLKLVLFFLRVLLSAPPDGGSTKLKMYSGWTEIGQIYDHSDGATSVFMRMH